MVMMKAGDRVVVVKGSEPFAPHLGDVAVIVFVSKNGFVRTVPHLGTNGYMWNVNRFRLEDEKGGWTR